MAVTLEWVRDHYDSSKDRHIDKNEALKAMNDLIYSGSITREQFDAVKLAYDNNTLLPAYSNGQQYAVTEHVTSINIQIGAMLKVNGVEVI